MNSHNKPELNFKVKYIEENGKKVKAELRFSTPGNDTNVLVIISKGGWNYLKKHEGKFQHNETYAGKEIAEKRNDLRIGRWTRNTNGYDVRISMDNAAFLTINQWYELFAKVSLVRSELTEAEYIM